MLDSLVDRAWSCFFERPPAKGDQQQQSNSDDHHSELQSAKGLSIIGDGIIHFADATGGAGGQQFSSANDATLDSAFLAMLAELDLSEERQAELLGQPRDWKRRMLVERERQRRAAELAESRSPQWALDRLRAALDQWPDGYALPLAVQQLEALAATLRTESISWLDQFLGQDGLSLLARLLDQCHSRGPSADLVALPVLASIRALLNSTIGRQWVQDSPETLRSVAWALDLLNARCKVISLEILSGLCFCAEFGHRAVLRALGEVTALRGERTRFQRLVDDLHREHGNTARDTERVRLALMSLVNGLLKSGAAEHTLELRVHLRHEFVMLGILQVLEHIRSTAPEGSGSALDDHVDLFEMMRQEDEQEMQSISDSGSASPIDFESPAGMAEVLTQRLDRTLALPHFISLLQHLLMVPADERHLPLWRCFDLLLQQLALQSAMGGLDPRGADPQLGEAGTTTLDWEELLSRLRTEAECEQLERKLGAAERELAEERRRALELENRLSDLQDSVSLVSFSRVSEHSSSSSTSPSDPCHSPPPFSNSSGSLPPIRPPVGQAPPPPPPTALQLRSGPGPSAPCATAPKKKVPKPRGQVRTLNWTPIPVNKIKGTIWEQIDEEKFYKQIEVEALSEQFAAGKASDDLQPDGGTIQLQKGRTMRHAQEQISVVDARRAQNCTIMLSRLKMSHREIRQTMLSLDERGRLSRDVLEQMLKFVPSREEIQQIREALAQRRKSPQALALADRFLWEMGQISRYEQRLRCLCTIRSFQDRVDELRPGIAAISRACTALGSSKRLGQLLSLVLAVGNVLNEGKRLGNAYGFTVRSLDQLPSVRSAARQDRNLVHFLAETVERKCPDLLRLKRELTAVLEAARLDRAQLEAELAQLGTAIRELARELVVQEEALAAKGGLNPAEPEEPSPTTMVIVGAEPEEEAVQQRQQGRTREGQKGGGDRFVPVVRAFLDGARQSLAQLQTEHAEMAQKYAQCVRLFGATGEESKRASELPPVEHFFGPFARCLNGLSDCHRAIWAEREEAEARKRQTLVRSLFQQRKRSACARPRGAQQQIAGLKSESGGGTANRDFEALVNMLQTGELFSEELSRLRTSVRTPKGSSQQHQQPRHPQQRQHQQQQQHKMAVAQP